MSIIMFDANTPVDENHTRTFATQLRNFFKPNLFDRGSRKRLRKIFAQDAAIVERATPNFLPETHLHELSVRDDRFMGSFRAARRRLIEKGWQIDAAAVAAQRNTALTIPSPQRRVHADIDWVMTPVPLTPPARHQAAAGEEALLEESG